MASCINMNSKEFQALVEKSGLNPLILKSEIGAYVKYTGVERLPTYEELRAYHEAKMDANIDTVVLSEALKEEGFDEDFLNAEEYEARQIEHAVMASPVKDSNTKSPEELETLRSYTAYKKYKEELLEKVEKNFEDFKKLNVGKRKSDEYKKRYKEFTEVLENLKQEIGNLKSSSEAEFLFGNILEELDNILSEFETKDPFRAKNFDFFYRADTLSRMLLGQELNGKIVAEDSFIIDGENIEGFDAFIKKAKDVQNAYQKMTFDIAEKAIKDNPLFVMAVEELSEGDVLALFKSMQTDIAEDINMAQQYFLGINSKTDTIYAKAINNLYQTNIKKVQQNVSTITQRVEELYHTLKDQGFDFEDFIRRDENGLLTDQLLSKYTDSWNRVVRKLFDMKKEVATKSQERKSSAYRGYIKTLANNAEVIDIRRLRVFRDKFGDRYGEYFNFSEEEMDTYERNLRSILGRTFDSEIQKQLENIERYEEYIQDLEDTEDPKLERMRVQNNPFSFVDDFYNPNKRGKASTFTFEDSNIEVYNVGNYNRFIPLKTKDGDDSGFYDEVFDSKVEISAEVFEMWQLLQKLLVDHINPAYSVNGQYQKGMTLPMLKNDFLETIARASKEEGVFAMTKAALNGAINSFKDMWYETGKERQEGELVANYSNQAKKEIARYVAALMLKPSSELYTMARALGLDFAEKLNKKGVAQAIAKKEVLKNYSTDIVKNILAVTDLAVLQRARQESIYLAEVFYELHTKVKSTTGGERRHSNDALRNWIDVNIYGSRNRKKEETSLSKSEAMKRLTDEEKKIKKILLETGINDETEFNFEGVHYFYDRKSDSYKSSIEDEEGKTVETDISKEDFEEAFGAFVRTQVDTLGIESTTAGIVSGLMSLFSMKFLGWNIISGMKNRFDGWFMNTIRDAEGIYWSEGNLKHSTKILGFANLIRMSGEKLDFMARKRAEQLRTLDILMEQMGVLQDRRDFRDKKDKVSTFGQLKKFGNIYNFAVGMPEYKNQVEIALSIMQDIKVKDAFGNEIGFCNSTGVILDDNGKVVDTGNYFPMYKPGTLKLRDEFRYVKEAFDSNGNLRTDINLEEYINTENIGFETFEINLENPAQNKVLQVTAKINDAISKTQGNFSNTDSVRIMDSIWGRAFIMFKRYLFEHLNQRFGKQDVNIATGQKAWEGRYRVLARNSSSLSIFAGAAAALTFTPAMGLTIAGGGLLIPFLLNHFTKKYMGKGATKGVVNNLLVAAGMTQELLVRSINTPLRFVPAGHDLSDIKPLAKNKAFEELMSRGVLTKDEIGALKANMQEIANGVFTISLILLAKSLFGGGEDDDEDKKRTRNYIDNLGNGILKNITQYYSLGDMWDDSLTDVILLGVATDAQKFGKYVLEYLGGKRESDSVWKQANKTFNPIPNYLIKTYQNITREDKKFFQNDREYDATQWFDKYHISPEAADAKYLKTQRSILKKAYIAEIMERLEQEYPEIKHEDRREIAKKISENLMKDAEISKQTGAGETATQAKERIDFSEANRNVKDKVSEYDIDASVDRITKAKEKKEAAKEAWNEALENDEDPLETLE